MKKFLLVFAAASCLLTANSQVTKQEVLDNVYKSGGVYYAYPVTETSYTKAPKGYKPVYISHYGRHGSRYLIGDNDYKWVMDVMNKAKADGALTPLGVSVADRIDSIWTFADGRGGDLTPLGVQQHRGIAERMYKAYPEVFKGNSPISARSTMVVRCVLSMDAFCERLKELDPNLKIDRDASHKHVRYLSHGTKEAGDYNDDPTNWKIAYENFEKENIHPEALMKRLFRSPQYVKRNIRPDQLMWGLYWIASDCQDMPVGVSLYDIFTPEELFSLWESNNLRWYLSHVDQTSPDNILLKNAQPLLRNFIESADEALAAGEPTATLRFGHDGNLMPLVGFMELAGYTEPIKSYDTAYETIADFKIVPMAGNLQLVFFRNEKNPDDVLVKFMLNEEEVTIPVPTDQYPFYPWKDVREFLQKKLQ